MSTQQPLLNQDAVIDLIPQKAPMVMIDKLWSSDEKGTVSGFLVKADNIFCDNNKLQEPGLIENVAQTVAIRAGYTALRAAEAAKGAVDRPLGYIAAIKNCNIYQLPSVNEELRTQIVVEKIIMSVSLIRGSITSNGVKILDCEMRIFQIAKEKV